MTKDNYRFTVPPTTASASSAPARTKEFDLRDHFALGALTCAGARGGTLNLIVANAYEIADLMLKEREK